MHSPEAELLVHPNVLARAGVDSARGCWLQGWMEAHGPPPPGLSLGWLRQAAAALDFAHRRGYAHGQLGPAALWIADSDHVKIAGLGFGDPQAISADLPALSWLAGKLLGTAADLPRARVLLRQASLGRFPSCSCFVEALRRGCEPEALDAFPHVSRRRIPGVEVVRWTLLFALSATSLVIALVALFLAARRSG